MPMRNRTTVPDQAKAGGPTQRDYSATIVALKTTPDRERNELISAIVDADRRLRDSVRRFLSMLADALGEPFPADALASRSFDELLTSLEQHARAAGFGRIHELAQAIDEARSAERQRNVIFSSASGDDTTALSTAASMLERLDAMFVGLCVEHVLEAHSRTARASAYLD